MRSFCSGVAVRSSLGARRRARRSAWPVRWSRRQAFRRWWASSITATSHGTRPSSSARSAAKAVEATTTPGRSKGFPGRARARSPPTTSTARPKRVRSSSRHWLRSDAGTSTTARSRPSEASCASTSPASMVLPSPTSSASTAPPVESAESAKAAASTWCGFRSSEACASAGARRAVPLPPRAVRVSAATIRWKGVSAPARRAGAACGARTRPSMRIPAATRPTRASRRDCPPAQEDSTTPIAFAVPPL